MNDQVEPHARKSVESLEGARSELANRRYNNAVNRAYFACYQAAIVALMRFEPPRKRWDHSYVQAQFSGLIRRRKAYPAEMRNVLPALSTARVQADYEERFVSRSAAELAVRRAEEFVVTVIGT